MKETDVADDRSPLPPVVTPEEWQQARDALLVKEKRLTRELDALAAERRRLPVVEFRADHAFEGPEGTVSLLDVFDGRRQLVVYHFMFEPGEKDVCSGCSAVADSVGHDACGVGGGFGLSAFLRDGERVYRSYFTRGRGLDRLRFDLNVLDHTALGRQETWEDSPAGWPQTPAYWWQLHDEYEPPKEPAAS
jgi:predicted dithiol-disulfide oxidoreductase (DUF899 family)